MFNEERERPARKFDKKKKVHQRKKVCRFCTDKEMILDYKDQNVLKMFVTERGKIIPRRISGNCAKHQRDVTKEVKRARNVALMPYTTTVL